MLTVSRSARGAGLGRALLQSALEACPGVLAARRAELEVRPENAAALRLYEHLGFEHARVHKSYYGDGKDAVVLQLALPPSGSTPDWIAESEERRAGERLADADDAIETRAERRTKPCAAARQYAHPLGLAGAWLGASPTPGGRRTPVEGAY